MTFATKSISIKRGKGSRLPLKTRSSSACHVGPHALENLIIFEQFWTHLNTFEHIWTSFEQVWTHLSKFEHIWTSLEQVWTCLNTFEHIWTGFEQVWTHLNSFEQVLKKFEHVWTHLNTLLDCSGQCWAGLGESSGFQKYSTLHYGKVATWVKNAIKK